MHDLSAVGRRAIKNASRRKKTRWHWITWHLSECTIEIRDRDPTTILSIRCTVNGRPKRNSPVGTRHSRTPSAIAQYLYWCALCDYKSISRTETEAPLRSITGRNGKLCTAGYRLLIVRRRRHLRKKFLRRNVIFQDWTIEKFRSSILVSLKNTSSFLLGNTIGTLGWKCGRQNGKFDGERSFNRSLLRRFPSFFLSSLSSLKRDQR